MKEYAQIVIITRDKGSVYFYFPFKKVFFNKLSNFLVLVNKIYLFLI